jgi:hypothetical protein
LFIPSTQLNDISSAFAFSRDDNFTAKKPPRRNHKSAETLLKIFKPTSLNLSKRANMPTTMGRKSKEKDEKQSYKKQV